MKVALSIIERLVARDQGTIAAIKKIRARTGCTLSEASAAVREANAAPAPKATIKEQRRIDDARINALRVVIETLSCAVVILHRARSVPLGLAPAEIKRVQGIHNDTIRLVMDLAGELSDLVVKQAERGKRTKARAGRRTS